MYDPYEKAKPKTMPREWEQMGLVPPSAGRGESSAPRDDDMPTTIPLFSTDALRDPEGTLEEWVDHLSQQHEIMQSQHTKMQQEMREMSRAQTRKEVQIETVAATLRYLTEQLQDYRGRIGQVDRD